MADDESGQRLSRQAQEAEAFAEQHRKFADRVERFTLRLAILTLGVVALVQTLQMIPAFRRVSNVVEGLEGIPWHEVTAWQGKGGAADALAAEQAAGPAATPAITIVLVTPRTAPGARLLIDGKSVGTFANGVVGAPVHAGQTIAIDGSGSALPLTFRVVGAVGVSSPTIGSSVTTERSTKTLGKVLLQGSAR